MAARDLASIDLNLLVALDALLSERNVTRAANKLGRTQPAMSHALARLRELLGDPLLVRTPTGMRTTPLADQTVEPLRAALAAVERALGQRARFDAASERRRFSLIASDYHELVLLPELAARLAREAPGVTVEIRSYIDPENALETGRVDLALGTFFDRTTGFFRQLLFKDRMVCLLRSGHPFAGATLGLDEFLRMKHLVVAPRGRPGGWVDDALSTMGLTRDVAMRVPHHLAAPAVVAETDMCLTTPERVARALAPALGLRQLPLPLDLGPISTSQVWHDRHHADPAHAWLRGLVAEIAGAPLAG